MPFYDSDKRRLNFETIGTGKPIVLIHGFTNYGLVWTPQLSSLVHRGYQVILPDLAGHGRSEPATAPTTVRDFARDIGALMDRLQIERATLCGLSLGAMVAQQMAIEQPGRVDGLILANSRATFADARYEGVIAGWIQLFEQPDGPRKRLQSVWPIMLNEAFRASTAGRATLAAWSDVLGAIPGTSLSNVARGMTSFDLRDRLREIRVPTLVIAGEQDKLFPPAETREIADGIPGARFEVITGAGHLSSLDSADAFNALLCAFVEAQGAPRT
jgi:3-oxoadipate enol-lactonase